MSEHIRYNPPGTSRVSPMRTRRFFKLLLKNAQRYYLENLGKGYTIASSKRDEMVSDALAVMGLTGNWYALNEAMTFKHKNWKRIARGKHFARLGGAAKKKGTTVSVLSIARCVLDGGDLRQVKFNNEIKPKTFPTFKRPMPPL